MTNPDPNTPRPLDKHDAPLLDLIREYGAACVSDDWDKRERIVQAIEGRLYVDKVARAVRASEKETLQQELAEADKWTPLPTSAEWARTRRELTAVKQERDHWKANHDNQVEVKRRVQARLAESLERERALQQTVDSLRDRIKVADQLARSKPPASLLTPEGYVDAIAYNWLTSQVIAALAGSLSSEDLGGHSVVSTEETHDA